MQINTNRRRRRKDCTMETCCCLQCGTTHINDVECFFVYQDKVIDQLIDPVTQNPLLDPITKQSRSSHWVNELVDNFVNRRNRIHQLPDRPRAVNATD